MSYKTALTRLGVAFLASSLFSIALYMRPLLSGEGREFSYLPWNLFLAWIAFGITFALRWVIQRTYWSSWQSIVAGIVWLVFLPNAFYMVSDFGHLQTLSSNELLYDTALFASFIFNALLLGFVSLYVIHRQLLRRASDKFAFLVTQVVLFFCSFGIYIGREFRLSTWDIFTNAPAVLFDVSDQLVHPANHPQTLPVTLGFFVLLSSLYVVFWSMTQVARAAK